MQIEYIRREHTVQQDGMLETQTFDLDWYWSWFILRLYIAYHTEELQNTKSAGQQQCSE